MLDCLPSDVKVFEVGPRDGLQNESNFVPTKDKVRLIESLIKAGIKNIEITSFVSPKWIPQLADGLDVAKALLLPPDVLASALVPNLKGYQAAREVGLREIAVFMSATEAHSKKNINKTIDEAIATAKEVAEIAHKDNVRVRGYLSVVFVCPFEGAVSSPKVAHLAERLFSAGIDELSLGDTIGAATPNQVIRLIQLLSSTIDLKKIALHFHDTCGTALANVLAALDCGVNIFDASVGGMGGCPYAPGAAGNLATEDLVYLLNGLGVKTGIDLESLVDCGAIAEEIVGRKLPGRYLQACLSSRKKKLALEKSQ